jgi:photosystem II stability/assembly factor-like uncharacterized protein
MKTKILLMLMIIFGSQAMGQQGWLYQPSTLYYNPYGAICSINKDTACVIANDGKFLKTVDGGMNWNETLTGSSMTFLDVVFSNGAEGYAVGTLGTIIKTVDGGINWSTLNTGTTKSLLSVFIGTSNGIWVVGDSGMILHSSDHGNTWTMNSSLTNKRLNSICFQDSGTGFIAGSEGTLLGTTDAGVTWNPINIGSIKDLFSLSITENRTYLLAGAVYGFSYYSEEMFQTQDHINWTGSMLGTSMPGSSRVFFPNDSVGFCISSNCTTNGECWIGIIKTTDSGLSWETSLNDWNPPQLVGMGSGDLVFATDSIGYALCGSNILKTTDGGTFAGIGQLKSARQMNIYPNPSTSGRLSIDLPGPDLPGTVIEISDIEGRVLYHTNSLRHRNNLDVKFLESGCYVVKCIQDNCVKEIAKFIVVK